MHDTGNEDLHVSTSNPFNVPVFIQLNMSASTLKKNSHNTHAKTC